MKQEKITTEAGFSLIQVLIVTAIMGLSIFLYFRARSQSQKARKIAESTLSVAEIKDAFISQISAVMRMVNGTTPGCLDLGAQLTARPLVKAFGTSTLTYTQAVTNSSLFPADLPQAERSKILQKINVDGDLAAAVRRCQSPQQPRNPASVQDNSFYFCTHIQGAAAAPPNSFLNSPLAFAEVGWRLLNLHTGSNTSCQAFAAANKSSGVQLFYTIYWAVQVNDDYIFKKSSESLTVGK